ncbi:MAG: nitroreductase family protein [Oscillospiraceae bacterium]|nr:nitroreductase family protein [Oscillospiraceae bacterium]
METLNAIAKRRSTRAFSPERQITRENLDQILAAGCAAPVGMADYGSIHLTVIRSQEKLAKINRAAQEAFKMDREVLYGAPTLVLVSVSEQQKAPNIQYANVACVVENMLLAATDIGIDCVYLWGAANVIAGNAALCKELGLPDGFKPVSAAALGYAVGGTPAEKGLGITLAVNYVD